MHTITLHSSLFTLHFSLRYLNETPPRRVGEAVLCADELPT